MTASSKRLELIDRLRYTFLSGGYQEIDILIKGLRKKDNFAVLCEEFFQGCNIDSHGNIVPQGFFSGVEENFTLLYAMYELLGSAPDTFLFKYRVSRVKILRSGYTGHLVLPMKLFSLPQLKILIVRNMNITRLPEAVSGMESLRVLDLSGNRLSIFPESILKLSNLSALNLSFNTLKTLPSNLEELKSLRLLSLRGNQLTQLPVDWRRMEFLRVLDISMNRLTFIPDSLKTLITLQEINLSYNDLTASAEAMWENRIQNGVDKDSVQGSLQFG